MKIFYSFLIKIQDLIIVERLKRVKALLKFCGSNVTIHHTCNIILPQRMEIGHNSYISSYTTMYATFGIKIGDNCLISSNCGISSVNHAINSSNRMKTQHLDHLESKPVVIGNNVWIGMNACILPGVTIGNNSIIGSGSVVTKDVPANEIWVGNPARFVKKVIVNPL